MTIDERAKRRWWVMVVINTLCMIAFTAALIWFGAIMLSALENRSLAHCETITTEVDDQGNHPSFCDG